MTAEEETKIRTLIAWSNMQRVMPNNHVPSRFSAGNEFVRIPLDEREFIQFCVWFGLDCRDVFDLVPVAKGVVDV